jgi:AcrR family transcriptional regulator
MPLEQTRSQDRRQRIIDAALSVFSRSGYADSSVDEIADESQTSKGGVYFHFPSKQAIFLALLNRTAKRLLGKIEEAVASESDPVARADAALLAVLRTFASHRGLARLFIVQALGAGPEFHQRMVEVRDEFAAVIKRHLDEAVEQGMIEAVDTEIASRAWFGALNEVITGWVLAEQPGRPLEDAYAALRPLLMRSIGARERLSETVVKP